MCRSNSPWTGKTKKIERIGSRWKTIDPFSICAHHVDKHPAGNADLRPHTSSIAEATDNNAEGTTGWSMYYGSKVPGFPAHPHRGLKPSRCFAARWSTEIRTALPSTEQPGSADGPGQAWSALISGTGQGLHPVRCAGGRPSALFCRQLRSVSTGR